MNLLITGGTGFFGRALIRCLESERLKTGHLPFEQITILSRSPDAFRLRYPTLARLPWIRWHSGDVLSPRSLPKQGVYHYILHAAADSTDATALTPLQRFHQITDGTENMLKFAVAHGNRRLLFVSSGAVYGVQPNGMDVIPENYYGMPDPLNPSNAYGVAKRQAEHLCGLYGYQYNIETVIARCFSFVGEDLPMNAHFAIGNFIRDALQADCINVKGDGSPLRSYLDQRDLAHWLLSILSKGKAGQAYNVGSDQAITIRELAQTVRDLISPDKSININGVLSQTSLRNRYIPCILKAKDELELTVTVGLEDAIRFAANCQTA